MAYRIFGELQHWWEGKSLPVVISAVIKIPYYIIGNLASTLRGFVQQVLSEMIREHDCGILKYGISERTLSVLGLISKMRLHWQLRDSSGVSFRLMTSEEINESYYNGHSAINEICLELEQFEFMIGEMKTFSDVIGEELYITMDAWDEFSKKIVRHLPNAESIRYAQRHNSPLSTAGVLERPTEQDFQELDELKEPILASISKIRGYLWDLSVTFQNELLRSVFVDKKPVEYRIPPDDHPIVLKPDSKTIENLRAYAQELKTNRLAKLNLPST